MMERLSLASFLANGHPYHLFVYENVKHVPAGAIIEDANAVLPASMIFKYKDVDSYAGFSNYFRYKLLLERGGWWVDTDMVCLRPFDFVDDDYVFASEITDWGAEVITSGVIKARPGSPLMKFAWETCLSKDPQEIRWGETGPRLMQEAVAKFHLEHFRKPYTSFCPVIHPRWRSVLEANTDALPGDAYAVHLWNELWRRAGQDKNGVYPASSLYEQLKRRYQLRAESW